MSSELTIAADAEFVATVGAAPPGTLVSVSARNAAKAPNATVAVSAPSSTPSAAAVSTTVAVRAPAPRKLTVGASVPPSSRLTPVFTPVPDASDSE